MNERYLSIGEKLRAARETHAITLDEAEAQTRIRKKFLQALENGDMSLLPSTAHAKGFLRNYAQYLGLNANVLVGELLGEAPPSPTLPTTAPTADEDVPGPASVGRPAPTYVERDSRSGPGMPRGMGGQPTTSPPEPANEPAPPLVRPTGPRMQPNQPTGPQSLPEPDPEEKPKKKSNFPRGSNVANIVAGVILLLGLVGTVFLVMMLSQVAAPEQTDTNISIADTFPTLEPSQTPRPTSTPNALGIEPEDLGRVQLALRATQSTWVRITIDGSVEFEGIIEPGEVLNQSGVEEVVLLISNAAALEINYNGAELGTLGGRGEIVERRFTANGDIIEPTATPTVTPTPTPVPSVTPVP